MNGGPQRYPALAVQRGMVLHTLRRPDAGVDVQQVALAWDGPPDRDVFVAAWQAATSRHAVLRTAFEVDGDHGVVQVVHPTVAPGIRWREATVDGFLATDRHEPVDVGRAPLLRVTVLSDHHVVVTFHHAILDGRSTRMLLDEILVDYAARRAGQPPHLPHRPPFVDFVRWWEARDPAADDAFWKGYLADAPIPRALPGRMDTEADAGTGARSVPASHEIVLTRSDSDRVRAAAARADVSVAAVVHAAWALLRGAYGGVDDVTVAVTRSCRYDSVPGAQQILGLLLTTVPLRVRLDRRWPVRRLLTDVADRIRQLRDHQLTPLHRILGQAGLAPDTLLLDSLVVFERQTLATALAEGGPEPTRRSARVHRMPGYPLTVHAFDEPELRLGVTWDAARLRDASARRILTQLHRTVCEVAERPDAALADLDLGATAEAPLRAAWNATRRPYPREASIPEVFATRVADDPAATALVVGDRTIGYAELDRAADRLARTLRGHGVTGESPVAVLLPRGEPLIRALLGVLKAGGAYLPVDPAAPPARIAGLLAASGTRLLLTTPATAANLPDLGPVRVLDVDTPPGEPVSAGPSPRIHPLQLACVLHTSGSTGAPKRVGITHRGVVRLVTGPDFATLGPGERLLQFAPTAFDASTWEIWGALLTGATAVVAPPDPVDLTGLTALIRAGGVTVAFLTAGLFRQLAETDVTALAGVRQLLTGGDVADPGTVRAVLAARGGLPLVNAYGPTENATLTSCHLMTGTAPVGDRVPIGRPVPQTTVHVLDADGRPVPVGVPGELCTGGDGLARGYLGDPAATAGAFVPDPQVPGGRLYRTGDVVRWRADGVLEFLGRRDDQVKIRGFRVEPGEVEAVLRAHPAVGAAVVGVLDDGTQRHLAGYVTPAGTVVPTPAGLRDHVAARLPAHLVPAVFTVLDRLPTTAYGKVDRAALPVPDLAGEAPHLAGPASPTEHRLAGLWSRLLPGGRPPTSIGRESSFFTLGGNSLTATRLMFRIRETFGAELGVGTFYRAPTLAATAAWLDAATGPVSGRGQQSGPALVRRERVAHPAGRDRPGHLTRLTDGWSLWRTVCLRGAGLPADLMAALGDAELAAAADRVVAAGDPASLADAQAAYAAAYPDAVGRLTVALHAVATHPRFREAVAWQNPHALRTGVDALLRRGPDHRTRNTKHRQHEALVTSYLQRYCLKNDTIGFFGPVGWARIEPGAGVRVDPADPPALLARRTVYLEGWAVAAVLAPYAVRLRPWLVPRVMPFLDLTGTTLRVPLAAPVTVSDAEAAVLRACDGVRDANSVAVVVLADPGSGLRATREVHEVLGMLAATHRIAWQPEAAPHDTHSERSLRTLLERVTDEGVRAPALGALDELCAARDALAASAGDPDGLTAAMSHLEATFERLAGVPATRRAGTMYAGRTPVYEECLRAGAVGVGEGSLDGIRAALALVLEGARWFTAAGATLYRRLCTEIYQRRAAELGTDVIPLVDFWLLAGEALFHPPQRLTTLLTTALHRRWADVLTLPAGGRRVRLTAAELAPAVATAFPAGRPGWPTARQHSPDLMRAGDEWVLGELHPGVNTLRYATWVACHPEADALRAAMGHDVGAGVVYPAETGQEGGVPTRQSNALTGAGDVRLVFAHDSFGHDPRRSLRVGECDLVGTAGGLRVRSRDGRFDADLMDVLGDVVGAGLSQLFRVLPPAAHQPRVTIDSLVVSREAWTFTAADLTFAGTRDEALRFRKVRAWATTHHLPRHVFLRCAGERKPVHADLTSLASVDLVSRAVRRARRHGGDDAGVGVVEMLPTPEQLWLTGPDGRYTAELRVVAVDGQGR